MFNRIPPLNRDILTLKNLTTLTNIILMSHWRPGSELYNSINRIYNHHADRQDYELVLSMLYPTLSVAFLGYQYSHYQFGQFRLWREKRDLSKLAAARQKLERLNDLENKFDNLSANDKERLVGLNLAIKDDVNPIRLKYICPITYSLMIQPVYIKVAQGKREYAYEMYDLSAINDWLKSQPRAKESPLTTRKLVQVWNSFIIHSASLLTEYDNYIKELSAELNVNKRLENR